MFQDKGTKTTSTQTFTVPYQIALDHIQVLLSVIYLDHHGGDVDSLRQVSGDEVKVFIKHPGGAEIITVQDANVPVKLA